MPERTLAHKPAVNVSKHNLIQDRKSLREEYQVQTTNKVSKVPKFHIRG